jgi:hypothetical protein
MAGQRARLVADALHRDATGAGRLAVTEARHPRGQMRLKEAADRRHRLADQEQPVHIGLMGAAIGDLRLAQQRHPPASTGPALASRAG